MTKSKNTKNNTISKYLVSILATYVFLVSLITMLGNEILIFWPLFLLIIVVIFVLYILYKNYKGKVTGNLIIGVAIESVFSTVIISHRLIGNLGDAISVHCDGLLGTTTKCSESIGFSMAGLGSILVLPMVIVAIISFAVSKKAK